MEGNGVTELIMPTRRREEGEGEGVNYSLRELLDEIKSEVKAVREDLKGKADTEDMTELGRRISVVHEVTGERGETVRQIKDDVRDFRQQLLAFDTRLGNVETGQKVMDAIGKWTEKQDKESHTTRRWMVGLTVTSGFAVIGLAIELLTKVLGR